MRLLNSILMAAQVSWFAGLRCTETSLGSMFVRPQPCSM
jgi:hypothetical protein